ncbi:MAG: tetratricopeptide repeat protein [Oscillatoriophycideae cyanobacterium NC_groundwater_1537_Pr4_S-0.65um_50_18]|nr:tetratricopeptide repeat protein [Oscillatoriophycideae cyanobacterium NC_groundwater_1537_Pr4_S-0.65um_50_18]
MRILHFDLKEISGDAVELRSFGDNPNAYDSRSLALGDIATLIRQAEEGYYVSARLQADLATTGRQLFRWLDGSDRWLVQKLKELSGEGVVLAIAVAGRLAHLPWEVLHDGAQFLVQRLPAVVPLRWAASDQVTELTIESQPQNRALNLLFMATSPESVTPVLDYEQEEAQILRAAARTGIGLTVEESGCLEELGYLVDRQGQGFFDGVHLTGHATFREGQPRFITETATGEAYYASAREIASTLQPPLPPLVFLSGCRTGQAAEQGAVPSMAEALLQHGATAVLGWGQNVLDTDATAAAAALYEALARGKSLADAVALTYQALIKQEARDWHLLRLYAAKTLPGALVKPASTPGWKSAPKPSMATEFLDPLTRQIRVPTRESFVGRRRPLQRCLRSLTTDPETIAVLIHGMGGLGKSSVAARLCDRLPQFQRRVWQGRIDPAKLVNELTKMLDDRSLRQRLQDPEEELPFRLRGVFQQLAEQGEKPFLLVLDDFEQNLEAEGTGYILKPPAAAVLNALFWAIQETDLRHRLILTSRYDFDIAPLQGMMRQPLDGLQGADLQKKCDRLSALQPPPRQSDTAAAEIELILSWQAQAKLLADGNPRLLETLNDRVQPQPQTDRAATLDQLAADPTELRQQVLEARLLQQIPDDLRIVLSRGLVFELPVPPAAFASVTAGEEWIDRAIALGLLEVSPDQTLRVPRILPLHLPQEAEPLYAAAAQTLYECWWQGINATEIQALEVHRLAMLAKNEAIAAELGSELGHRWYNQSRFRDAVALGEKTVALTADYRIHHSLARSQATLGAVVSALENYQKALATCPEEDQQQKAAILHNSAGIYAQQGQVNEAIELYQQSLALLESIGDVKGKAASLHCMAILYAQQGQVNEAIALYQQSLALYESIGNVQGKAASLHQMAVIYAQQGQMEDAIALFQESLEIEEKIGNVQGKAMTLWWLGGLANQQGNPSLALPYLQEAFEILQHLRSPKAAQVEALLQAVQQQLE